MALSLDEKMAESLDWLWEAPWVISKVEHSVDLMDELLGNQTAYKTAAKMA